MVLCAIVQRNNSLALPSRVSRFLCAGLSLVLSIIVLPSCHAQSGTPDVRSLVEKTHSRDPAERASAAKMLGQIGPEAVTAIPDLLRLLDDSGAGSNVHPDIEAFHALRSLGEIAVVSLVEVLNDRRSTNRDSIATLLGEIRGLGKGTSLIIPVQLVNISDVPFFSLAEILMPRVAL